MGLFKKKNKDYVDLTGHLKKQREIEENFRSEPEEKTQDSAQNTNGIFNFFGGGNQSISPPVSNTNSSNPETTHPADRRKKLAKRLINMTERIEELEKTTNKLKERVEYLERKNQSY